MRERNLASIWRNTPSPPPEERARLQAKLAEEARRQREEHAAQHHHHRAKKEEEASLAKEASAEAALASRKGEGPDQQEDPALVALQEKEASLFQVCSGISLGVGHCLLPLLGIIKRWVVARWICHCCSRFKLSEHGFRRVGLRSRRLPRRLPQPRRLWRPRRRS